MFTADQAYLDAKDFPGVAIILGAYAKIILGAYAKKNRLRKRVQMPLALGRGEDGVGRALGIIPVLPASLGL